VTGAPAGHTAPTDARHGEGRSARPCPATAGSRWAFARARRSTRSEGERT
jgi:hypothetical protein